MKKIYLLLSSFLASSCSIFGINNGETLNYKTVYTDRSFEIRQYSSYIVAEVSFDKNEQEQSTKAFKVLARYIFGNNTLKESIRMTAPVIEKKSQNIPMTTPVNILNSNNKYTMHFVMPKKYSLQNLPSPKDEKIILKKINSKLVAVLSYTWSNSEQKKNNNKEKLFKWIKENNYNVVGDPSFASYNPPWTIPFLKRNEVVIEVSK